MHFSTRDFTPPQRQAAWRDIVNSYCGEFSFDFSSPEFEANLDVHHIGPLSCAKLTQSLKRISRNDIAAMQAQEKDAFVLLQLAGKAQLFQGDQKIFLLPGDITIIDAGSPFELNLREKNSQICIHVKKDIINQSCTMDNFQFATKAPPSTSFIIHSIINSVFSLSDFVNEDQRLIIADTICTLLNTGWDDDSITPNDRFSETLQKVKGYVLAHLTDENLTPRAIASATAISERHLHRIFNAAGQSVSNWIRQNRLDRCATDLRNPRLAERSITEIAFGWGFNDSAHFSRLFRKQYGVPPREYRRAGSEH